MVFSMARMVAAKLGAAPVVATRFVAKTSCVPSAQTTA
jgi:hypothetical protein